jgi:hypothetical protein
MTEQSRHRGMKVGVLHYGLGRRVRAWHGNLQARRDLRRRWYKIQDSSSVDLFLRLKMLQHPKFVDLVILSIRRFMPKSWNVWDSWFVVWGQTFLNSGSYKMTTRPKTQRLPSSSFFGEKSIEVLEHPACSSDLAPCDLLLYPTFQRIIFWNQWRIQMFVLSFYELVEEWCLEALRQLGRTPEFMEAYSCRIDRDLRT